METLSGSSTFIVRVSRDDQDCVIGIVERARTGQKERFRGLEHLAEVIARMLTPEGPDQPGDSAAHGSH